MATIGNLIVHIGANLKDLEDALKKSKGLAGGIGDSIGSSLKGGAVAGLTAIGAVGTAVAGTMVAGAAASLNAFIPFQQQMNEVFTLLPGISQSAMASMTQDVLDFSAKFGTLPEEVVPALYQAISAGVPPDNVFAFMETAQKAAIGGVSDLTTSIDGITSVVNAYGADVISAGQASDEMFTAVRLGKTTFGELSASLFNVIPTAASLGVSFGDVTAALAAMTAQGVPTSVATTQLRQLLVELSKDGSKAQQAFEGMAGVGLKEFVAQGHNLNDALGIMLQVSNDSGKSLSDLFGSVEAGNAALALTGSGAATFANDLAAMAESGGATNAAFQTMDSGIGRALDKAQAFGQTLLITTGQSLSPMIEKLIELGQSAMPTVQDIMARAQPIFETFATTLGDTLAPAAAIIVDSINRMAQALGLTNENMTGSDLILKLLKGTLDLVIVAVKATALVFEFSAEAVQGWRIVFDLVGDSVQKVNSFIGSLNTGIQGLLNPILTITSAWNDLVGALGQGISIPDWLVPGSPTPLELGLRGIKGAMDQLPPIGGKFEAATVPAAGLSGAGGGTNIYIDGIHVAGGPGGSIDEALQLAFEQLRQRLGKK